MFLSWHGEQFQIYKICTCNYAPLRHGLCQCKKVYLKINNLGAVFFLFFSLTVYYSLYSVLYTTFHCSVSQYVALPLYPPPPPTPPPQGRDVGIFGWRGEYGLFHPEPIFGQFQTYLQRNMLLPISRGFKYWILYGMFSDGTFIDQDVQ